MGMPIGQKLATFSTDWVQTLQDAYLWNQWMDLLSKFMELSVVECTVVRCWEVGSIFMLNSICMGWGAGRCVAGARMCAGRWRCNLIKIRSRCYEAHWPKCWDLHWGSGAYHTKAYDVTIYGYHTICAKIPASKIYILQCMGSKFHKKIIHTPQNLQAAKRLAIIYPESFDILSPRWTTERYTIWGARGCTEELRGVLGSWEVRC